MSLRRETLALLAVVASAAALALLTGFATTGSPLAGFLGLGGGAATSEPVDLQVLKDLVISPAAGAQGKLEETSWLKLIRYNDVNTTKIRLELENIKQLAQYYRYLIIQIREAHEEWKGPTPFEELPPRIETSDNDSESAPDNLGRYALDSATLAGKIYDVSANYASEGVNVTAFAWRLLGEVAHVNLTLINNTETNPGRRVLVEDLSLDDIVERGLWFSVKPVHPNGNYSIRIFYDNNPSVFFWDSYENESLYIAEVSDGGTWPDIAATNYTLILEFIDKEGNVLFTMMWNVTWYDTDTNGVYDRVEAQEYMSSLYPVLVLGNIRATLGFDRASGWWQPEDTLVVDEDSWKVDGGRAAVYGVTVFYEGLEGVLFDSLPLVINAEVLETS
ncbi:hypothetical protein [Pyrodictium abyssi]|uniref:Uncharacterized protein n=1 Tax=Pyrodictium abyssi TaxID=54256 RepID=A0ABN6ZLI6_9CREN|nr:hypothetical protein PABY_07030 [Pyrodictium abyssi]